jgi:hypothetical protein
MHADARRFCEDPMKPTHRFHFFLNEQMITIETRPPPSIREEIGVHRRSSFSYLR